MCDIDYCIVHDSLKEFLCLDHWEQQEIKEELNINKKWIYNNCWFNKT